MVLQVQLFHSAWYLKTGNKLGSHLMNLLKLSIVEYTFKDDIFEVVMVFVSKALNKMLNHNNTQCRTHQGIFSNLHPLITNRPDIMDLVLDLINKDGKIFQCLSLYCLKLIWDILIIDGDKLLNMFTVIVI